MSGVARVRAQAKLNLFLRIVAREQDGYHQIETLFCRLDLADDVTVRVSGVTGRSLDTTSERSDAADLGPIEKNLAWRAAEAYAAATGWPDAFAIELTKRIPVGGGLGGGSADGAAVLRALDVLSPRPVGVEGLAAIGAGIGADVPYLTTTAPLALGWGRGERLLALPPLPMREVWLACFDFGVPTGDAYRWLDEEGVAGGAAPILTPERLTTWRGVAALATNDFEPSVASRYPAISDVLAGARDGRWGDALGDDGFALLAGSGATVAIVPSASRDGGEPSAVGVSIVRTTTAARVADVVVT